MRVLLDESVPRRLGATFPKSFEVSTVQQMGWAGYLNGRLLRLAADHGFEALLTVDRGFEYEQNLQELPIPVVILIARRSRLQELQPLVGTVVALLSGDTERRIYLVEA